MNKRRESIGRQPGVLVQMQPAAAREALQELRPEHLQHPRLDTLAAFCGADRDYRGAPAGTLVVRLAR